jgi:hypothetical protein
MPTSPLEDSELTPEPHQPAGCQSPGSVCPAQYDRRSDSRRGGDDGVCREQRPDPRRADLARRPSDARVDSYRHGDWRGEPRRDQRRRDEAREMPENYRAKSIPGTVRALGFWLRPPQPLHPSDRAPTSVCVVCAFQCVNLASPAAGAHRAGYGALRFGEGDNFRHSANGP